MKPGISKNDGHLIKVEDAHFNIDLGKFTENTQFKEKFYSSSDSQCEMICENDVMSSRECDYTSFHSYIYCQNDKRIHLDDKLYPSAACELSMGEDTKPFTCTKCNFISSDSALMDNHMVTHTGEKSFSCVECSYSCTEQSDLTNHVKFHSQEDESFDVIPVEIIKTEEHLMLSHCKVEDTKLNVDLGQYAENDTDQFDEKLCSINSLRNLHADRNQNLSENEFYLSATSESSMEDNESKPFICTECDYISTDSTLMKNHMVIHSKGKIFSCTECSYSSFQKSYLKTHMMIHREKPFSCADCTYCCTKKSDLTRHIITHTGKKPFSCTKCDFTCTRKSHLNSHMMIHTGEKPFSCKDCSYTCSTLFGLRRHVLVHTGEKPFPCKICNYKCPRRSDLKNHMMIHTGEKPFTCAQCGYSVSASSKLRRHIATHSKKK